MSGHHKTPHTSVRKGKRVRIVLRDGEEIIDKFDNGTDRFVFLEGGRKIEKVTIRSFGIYRAKV
jgi:hypothetical protein